MFSDIAGVRAALKERLAPALPEGWTIDEYLRQPPTEYRAPIVIFVFDTIESAPNGQQLGPGQVGAAVDILMGSPNTVEGPGEDDVDELALALVHVLDRQPDLAWSTAEKQKLPAGQWAWRIHTIALTSSKE